VGSDRQRNCVLGGGPEVLRNVAMATNFGTKIAINGFVLTIARRSVGYWLWREV